MPLHVGLVVEGHGEYEAIRILLQRIGMEILGGEWIEVNRPFRQPQGSLLKEDRLKKAVDAVRIKLGPVDAEGPRKVVLVLIDAEKACPKELAPRLLGWAKEARSDANISVVLPNPMFETWFVAAGSSLAGVNGLPADLQTPDDPEGQRQGKSWIKKKLPRQKYTETVDQPRFSAKIDLSLCRRNSPSFDKLCRELEKWMAPAISNTAVSDSDQSSQPANGSESDPNKLS